MEVRAATVGDGSAIGRVQVAVWREAYSGLMHPEPLAAMDDVRIGGLWTERLTAAPPGLRTWVAVHDDEVVGFATAGPDGSPPTQRLFAVNLLSVWHGSGAADALLGAVVVPGPCLLWVVLGNARAIAFYERRGFAADGATTYDERLGVTEQRMVRPG